MDPDVRPSPRKARKSFRSQGNTITTPNINQPLPYTTSSPNAIPGIKKNARKSIPTPSLPAIANQTNQSASIRTRSSVSSTVSQNTTIALSQVSRSYDDDSSDSDVQLPGTRTSVANSLNSTLPLSKAGCSKNLVFSDSNDSDVEETLNIKTAKKHKAQTNAGISSTPKITAGKSHAPKTTIGKLSSNPDKLVSYCVFYILVANRNKKAIKKRDIIQNVFEGRNVHMFPDVLNKAATMLQKTFGFELMELKSNKNEYLLVNNMSHQYDIQDFAEGSRMDYQKQGFVFYILTLIFMNENSILEEELWKALEPLGVEIKSRKPHPIFGDVQKLVTNVLVKEMYLERRMISKDPPQFELFWGERAHKEVLKEDLLDFACKIMPDTKPEEWILQYKDAKGRAPDVDTEME